MSSDDKVVRAMTQDGQFRVICAVATNTVAEARRRQVAPQELVDRQSLLVCAGVLIRETMQPGNRVQIVLKDAEGHRLVTDSMPDGKNRSIVNPGEEGGGAVADQGLFQVAYTLRNGELHQGIIAVEHTANISAAMMRYLKESEQITAFVCIDSAERDGRTEVGGFVMQFTPEATSEGITAMTEHLVDFQDIGWWLSGDAPDPYVLIERLLQDHEFSILASSELEFGCTCSKERMLLGISTLGQVEVAEMIADEETLDINCDACGAHYRITPDELVDVLKEQRAAQDPEKN